LLYIFPASFLSGNTILSLEEEEEEGEEEKGWFFTVKVQEYSPK
jgi:hypothetical protein